MKSNCWRKTPVFLSLALLVLPAFALAAEINAGFPAQSIWVSTTNVTAGENVEVFTVVYNGTKATLKGAVAFLVDDGRIGAKDFELAAGASSIVSTAWKAVVGTHRLAAMIERASSSSLDDFITLSKKETTSITLIVAEPPPPPPLAKAATAASDIIAEAARVATPVVSESANAAYEFVESVRLDAISRLEKIVGNTTSTKSPTTGSVAGTSTPSVAGFNESGADTPSGFSQMKQVAASAALVAFQSRAIFYPLFIFALFGLLYLLFRWATKRPRVRY